MLKRLKVRIPYAEQLTLPTTKLVARRAFGQLLAFIEAVALLRQKQKKPRDGKHIHADTIDYDIAYRLMLPILRRTFAPLGERAKKLLAAILDNALPSQTFKRVDCAEWAGVGSTEVRNRLAALVEAGLVEQVGGSKGLTCSYKVVSTEDRSAKLNVLLKPATLRKRLKKAKKK